jgi:hypothetical protein
LGFPPHGNLYSEQFLFHFHHANMIAHRVGHPQSHQKES